MAHCCLPCRGAMRLCVKDLEHKVSPTTPLEVVELDLKRSSRQARAHRRSLAWWFRGLVALSFAGIYGGLLFGGLVALSFPW